MKLQNSGPAEIIVNSFLYSSKEEIDEIRKRFKIYINNFDDENFKEDKETLLQNYNLLYEDKVIENLDDYELETIAINGLLAYLSQTQKMKLDHINHIKFYNLQKYMALDIAARRNLELLERQHDKGKKGTLLWVLDKTSTSMGGRMMRKWIGEPLLDVTEINKRLEAVGELKDNGILRGELQESLKRV